MLFFRQGLAQRRLSGRFLDKAKHPIPYLEVILSVEDSSVAGALTDRKGAFKLNVPSGRYTLEAEHFGKTLYKKRLRITRSTDLGTLTAQGDLQLSEIAVSARKKLVEQKIDRLIFNVKNSTTALGGDVMDALSITPGVRVEGDHIKMIGKGSMRVMVDGHILPLSGEQLTDFLASIPADDIERIEVITTPPAKYEAQGDSGLLNIVYKKGRRDPWNAYIRGVYSQRTYARYQLGGGFSYHKNKLSLLLSLSEKPGSRAVFENSTTYYPQQIWTDTTTMRVICRNSFHSHLTLDYALTQKARLGFQYLGWISRFKDISTDSALTIGPPKSWIP